jgi:hypothetical protein
MEQLINELNRMNKGSNVHTINKAIFYLEKALNKGVESKLVEPVKKAIQSNDWTEVKMIMWMWW